MTGLYDVAYLPMPKIFFCFLSFSADPGPLSTRFWQAAYHHHHHHHQAPGKSQTRSRPTDRVESGESAAGNRGASDNNRTTTTAAITWGLRVDDHFPMLIRRSSQRTTTRTSKAHDSKIKSRQNPPCGGHKEGRDRLAL